MIVATGLDGKMDGDFVEEWRGGALSEEVFADGEKQLVVPGECIGEEGGVATAVGTGRGVGKELAAVKKADPDVGGGITGGGVENVSREFSHLS